MIIPINEQYRLRSDEYQWIIEKQRTRKGKEDWQGRFFYTTVKAAVEGLGELMVRRSKANTLVDALKEVEKVTTTLSQALTPQIEGLKDLPRTGTDE